MSEQSSQRGQGRLAGALARKSRGGAGQEIQASPETMQRESGGGGSVGGSVGAGSRGRGRAKGGGRSGSARRGGSAEYKQSLAYIKREVRDRVDQARTDPEVRAELEAALRERGVAFKPENPEYSALIELLLLDWLDDVDYGLNR